MEARGWGIVGVLRTTVIHSNVAESYTESHWAPERKRGLWKQTGLFNYHGENWVTLGDLGSATPGAPASCICVCRGLCLEVLGGGGGEGVAE